MSTSPFQHTWVNLEELERFAADHKLDLKLTKLAGAREYRETVAMCAEKNRKTEEPAVPVEEELPASLA